MPENLSMTGSVFSWVAFLLHFRQPAIILSLWGELADIYGQQKGFFLYGAIIFYHFFISLHLVTKPDFLIIVRALQGVGGVK